ncbi:MAG: peptidoglycan-binding protein, partial [Candidatus Heimdallarchaeota archaeon]|nr:peptidoglycan-binding protein [Candidatus Heimdallarchaeota archaeon]
LLIQQNKNEIDAVLDKTDELALDVSFFKDREAYTVQPSSIVQAVPRSAVGIKKIVSKTAVVSDKFSNPPSVKNIQKSLRNAGFYIGKVDGKVGPLTRRAIKKFQEANSLGTDGVIGRKTWEKLKYYL